MTQEITNKINLTQEELREVFRYEDGNLFWNKKPSHRVNISKPAGYICKKDGYRRIRFKGAGYTCHRLAWVLQNGSIEGDLQIDHKNGKRWDNRIENLHVVTHQMNLRLGRNKNAKGYTWVEGIKKWKASITVNNKILHLGCFKIEADARLAYVKAMDTYWNLPDTGHLHSDTYAYRQSLQGI